MKRDKLINKFNNALEKMTLELKGETFTDDELNEIGLRTSRFVQELYSRRSQESRAAQHAFTEALTTLRKLRSFKTTR